MKKIKIIFPLLILVLLAGCSLTEKEPTDIEKEPTIIEIQNEVTEVYETVSKGCVGIYASKTGSNTASIGSGVIYKESNGLYYVVTNEHVIEDMDTIRVYLGGSKYYGAELVGYDAKNDIAVLTFSLDLFGGPEIYVIDIFSYEEEIVKPGQTVLAIGCPLSLSNYNSLSTGVVSRVEKSFIQTNAEINPGNSGGGLFNLSGRLIGLNEKKEIYTNGTDNSGSAISVPVEGMGYAISLSVIKKCITAIENKKGEIERPTLGITISVINRYLNSASEYLNYIPNGMDEAIVVTEVNAGVAKNAGVFVFDVILKVDDVEVKNTAELSYFLNLKLKGETLTLMVYRYSAGTTKTITIIL